MTVYSSILVHTLAARSNLSFVVRVSDKCANDRVLPDGLKLPNPIIQHLKLVRRQVVNAAILEILWVERHLKNKSSNTGEHPSQRQRTNENSLTLASAREASRPANM